MYHFVFSTKLELARISDMELPMLRFLDGPPAKFSDKEKTNLCDRWCDTVQAQGTGEEETRKKVFNAGKFAEAEEMWKCINSKFWAILVCTMPVFKKHLVSEVKMFDGFGLWQILVGDFGNYRGLVYEINQEIHELKLETLTVNNWNVFVNKIVALRDELNGLPGLEIGDQLSPSRFLWLFVDKIRDFFPSISTAMDLDIDQLDFKKVINVVRCS